MGDCEQHQSGGAGAMGIRRAVGGGVGEVARRARGAEVRCGLRAKPCAAGVGAIVAAQGLGDSRRLFDRAMSAG